jgi:phage-related holin
MRVQSVASLFVVVAILFIMAVAAEVFVGGFMQPSSLFSYLIVTTLITGVLASVIIQKIDAKLLV